MELNSEYLLNFDLISKKGEVLSCKKVLPIIIDFSFFEKINQFLDCKYYQDWTDKIKKETKDYIFGKLVFDPKKGKLIRTINLGKLSTRCRSAIILETL